MAEKRVNQAQVIWAIALILAGLGVFYRIPQVMPSIEQISRFSDASGFIRFCFYFIGLFLVGGGCRKLYDQFGKKQDSQDTGNDV
ncbi:MAG: hypothetical protein CR984_00305 [Proteobacteria bacterium]|nr:MAG: hypothetical protein CR984_00305 [Pseudomonadota bacterium]PIE66829.1 MAG: hypothetical protein CSA23_07090 [Deltaproteobacteria bacterium]